MTDIGAIVRSCREEISAVAEILKEDISAKESRGNNAITVRSAPHQESETFPTFPYVATRKNKDGSRRYYFKRKGFPLRPLPEPTSPEFLAAYAAASAAPGEPIPAAGLTFTLHGDDPLAAPLIMIWCALKSGDRDRAENIFVRLVADETKVDDAPDRRDIDAAMAVALAMVRAKNAQ